MRFRRLGNSEIQVSEIGLGSWLTYSGGVSVEATRACTVAAFDAGVNFFDTADVYGQGAAESAWGEILSAFPRDAVVLATKVWGPMSDDPADRGLSAAHVAEAIDGSLKRLQVDHVDLYQAHRFDPRVPVEEIVEAFQRVVDQGKARYLGFSEWTPEQIDAAVEVGGADLFVSSQPQYSMLWQAPEAELFDACRPLGVSHVVWSPLAQGLLTGKYRPDCPPPAGSRRADPDMGESIGALFDEDRALRAVERLRSVAADVGLDLSTLALAWVLRRSEVACAITGASRAEQVQANAAASGIELTSDLLEAVDAALGDVPVRQPTLAPGAERGITRR